MRIIWIVDFILAEFGKRIACLSRSEVLRRANRFAALLVAASLCRGVPLKRTATERRAYNVLGALLNRRTDLIAPFGPRTVVVADVIQT